MNAAIKNVVLETVYSTYMFVLFNFFAVYMGSLMKDIINHLMSRYGRIVAGDIEMNKKSSKNP